VCLERMLSLLAIRFLLRSHRLQMLCIGQSHGVQSVVVGETIEEWYLHSTADIIPNLLRYFPHSIVDALISKYPTLPDTATPEESQRLFGDILADGQVNIPDRLLARDLRLVNFPVLRYEIHWVPEQLRIGGKWRLFFLQSRPG